MIRPHKCDRQGKGPFFPGAEGTTTYNHYHIDGNGNITYLVNASQASVAAYRYDPFGRTVISNGTLATAKTYRFSSKRVHLKPVLLPFDTLFNNCRTTYVRALAVLPENEDGFPVNYFLAPY